MFIHNGWKVKMMNELKKWWIQSEDEWTFKMMNEKWMFINELRELKSIIEFALESCSCFYCYLVTHHHIHPMWAWYCQNQTEIGR
jgi:hypothetical protein